MEQQKVEELFARASRINPEEYDTRKELQLRRAEDGAKRFKRLALGLGGLFGIRASVVKDLDGMAELFYKSGITSSLDDGRKVTIAICEDSVCIQYNSVSAILFEKVENQLGETNYRIRVYSPSP